MADADGEDILLGAPSVAAQVAIKKSSGSSPAMLELAACAAGIELDFVGDHRRRGGFVARKRDTEEKCPPAPTTSRALMSPLTIQRSPVRSTGVEGDTFADARATTPQQIFVKLAAQDAVADGPTVVMLTWGSSMRVAQGFVG